MAKLKAKKKISKRLVLGDDAIRDPEADWFDFETPASALAEHLYLISKSSGVCCGVVGSWGSGKSSFMKLMDKHIKEKHGKSVCVAWFTAWDPGGIEDLGDAMLYRFFHDISMNEKALSDDFNQLKQALGIRKSFKEKARRVLNVASTVLPETPAKKVVEVAGGMLAEWDAPEKVKKSFENLMQWLEKNDTIVFLFVDDIDRASGEQIRDILSELKIYISNRRICVVLGYDEPYVVESLKNVLPVGIDPKKYLEKIVTVKRQLPLPNPEQTVEFAASLLGSLLDINYETRRGIANIAAQISLNNPRRLKMLILDFCDYLSALSYKEFGYAAFLSFFISCAAVEMGALSEKAVKEAFDSGNEEAIVNALKALAEKNPNEREKLDRLIWAISFLAPSFSGGILSSLRLVSSEREVEPHDIERHEVHKRYRWEQSIAPIMKSAANIGFKLNSEVVEPRGIVIDPSTELRTISLKELEPFKLGGYYGIESSKGFLLVSKKTETIVLLSSLISEERDSESLKRYVSYVITSVIDYCPFFVLRKDFILWIIDDAGVLPEDFLAPQIKRADESSASLKHSFLLCFTQVPKINDLLACLLQPVKKIEKED